MFFAVLVQSSFGTGAAHPALLLLAYERFRSPWALALVLLADLLPAMLFGPLFGAAADRWSRRRCLVVADVVRAGAFAGIAVVDGFAATVALALLGGAGTGLYTPAALAALPGLAPVGLLPAATSIYGAITDLGFLAGPALAAVGLMVVGPESIMAVNGATFALSAVVLARLRFGEVAAAPATGGAVRRLVGEAREGLAVLVRARWVGSVVVASTALLFFAGLFNVAELPFARDHLGVGAAAFALLVAAFGAGVIAGSLVGSRGGEPETLRRNFLAGLLLAAAGLVACGLSFSLATGLLAFAAAGVGNGLVLVHERLLIQTTLPDGVLGRVFGAKDALSAWAFGLAFAAAGGLVSLLGARTLILLAGGGCFVVWCAAAARLRGAPARRRPGRAARRRAPSESRPWPEAPARPR